MKTKLTLALCLVTSAICLPAFAQGTAFTYQGRLNDSGGPASGSYDLTFTLFSAASGNGPVGGSLTNSPVAVSNGLFTATLDFGAGVFIGANRWLEIGVRTNGSVAAYTTLAPRQPLTAAPYAIHAGSAGTVGAVSWNSISGVPVSVMSNMLGSVGNAALELKVNGQRALRLEPTRSNDTVNVLAGSSVNAIATNVISATIAGGGTPQFNGGLQANFVGSDFGTIGGGAGNRIGTNSNSGVIGGGFGHTISDNTFDGTISGGSFHLIGMNAAWTTIGGGTGNWIQEGSGASTIAGGAGNGVDTNSGYSVIAGGLNNSIKPFAGLSAIGGGWLNLIENGADQSVIAGGNAGNIQAGARESFIGGGFANTIQTNAANSFIGGGSYNTNAGGAAVIGGGEGNAISNSAPHATIAGGIGNGTDAEASFIGGGVGNTIQNSAYASFIGGGRGNSIQFGAFDSTIGGGVGNTIQTNASNSTIGGGLGNTASAFATVGGGRQNANSGDYATVGGGYGNTIGAGDNYGTIAGGSLNMIQTNARSSTISGGARNTISADAIRATIAGGIDQFIATNSHHSVIGGGELNTIQANSDHATISGGSNNSAGGIYATVPGGAANIAAGQSSLAAGRRAKANHAGAFVWGDNTDADIASTKTNEFVVRAGGGVRWETAGAGATLDGQSILSGTVPSAGLAGTYSSAVTFNNSASSFSGNGAGLTGLNAANLSGSVPGAALTSVPAGSLTGTIVDARLSSNVALRSGGNVFTGNQIVSSGSVGIGIAPQSTLDVNGTARIDGANNWDVTSTEGDFRVGNDSYRFKIGVATGGGGSGDVWMRTHGGTARLFLKTPGGTTIYSKEDQTVGVSLAANGTSWAVISDRNVKKDFAPVDSREILEKLAAMPITQWHYKWEEASVTPHIGPMAQDFKAAFYPGTDDKSITTQEADGVALAAIQGLNEKVEVRSQKSEASIQELKVENAELKHELAEIKRLLVTLTSKGN